LQAMRIEQRRLGIGPGQGVGSGVHANGS